MLLLLDRDETFIASLPYNNPLRKRELNGLNTFEVETSREVEDGQRLVFKDSLGKWNEYIIYDHFKTHDSEGVKYEVYAEDSTSELYGTYIDDFKPRKAKATAILAQILENTRFEVGRVDDFEVQSFNLYHTNAKKALWTILEKYGAEIQVRIEVEDNKIIHRYIDLKQSIGKDNGKRFTYKKDMQGVKKTTSTKNLATKIYVYGKGEEIVGDDGHPTGGYGRKINFAEINGGKKYLEDEEARLLYGYGKERKHIEATVEFSDCEDKAELLELGKKALKEMSKPEITYELKVEDISRYNGYIGEGVDLGDTVLVIDKEIDLRVQTRVVSITDNPLEEIKDSEIVLGNFIRDLSENQTEYEKLKNQLENRNQSLYDELQKLAEGVEGSYIDSVVERFNEELNATGGWVYAEKGEGIIILNAPRESGNATQAIKLAGGIIGIANSKKSNGDFDYRTFGDGNGFTADLIVAGILKGGKVKFNLEDGTFLIGHSVEDYLMYFDGSTLHFRNVDFDLSNSKDFIDFKKETNSYLQNINTDIDNLGIDLGDITKNFDDYKSSNDEKITDIENQNDLISSEILKYQQDFEIANGKLSSDISTLRKEMVEGDSSLKDDISNSESNVKTYIRENYSTITQTDEKISLGVSSLKTDIDDLEGLVKINTSNITQTQDSIDLSISQINKSLDGKVDTKRIISEINASEEGIKISGDKVNIDASKLDLKVDEITTTWSRYNTNTAIHIKNSTIDLYNDSGAKAGGLTTGYYASTGKNIISLGHDSYEGTLVIDYGNYPYMTFDEWGIQRRHPITVHTDIEFLGDIYGYIDFKNGISSDGTILCDGGFATSGESAFNGKTTFRDNVYLSGYSTLDIGTNNIKIGSSGRTFSIETINYSDDTALRFKWTDSVWFEYRKSGSLYMKDYSGVKKVFSID